MRTNLIGIAALLWVALGCGEDEKISETQEPTPGNTNNMEPTETNNSQPTETNNRVSCAGLDWLACEELEYCAFLDECVEAPTAAECHAMNEEQCLAAEACGPKYGQVLHDEKYCGIPTFFSCERSQTQNCTNSYVLMQRDDGHCAYFSNGCPPSVGIWTENGVRAEDCGLPAFLDAAFSVTCLDWEGGEGNMPTEPYLVYENHFSVGTVEVGSTGTRPLQIVNVGTPMTIIEIQMSGDAFSVEMIELPFVIEQGESLVLDVSVTRIAAGPLSSTISITAEEFEFEYEIHVRAD